jgi:tryptophan synthase alpha chain
VTVTRIANAFATARRQGRIALMPYLVAGYPSIPETLELALALADAGADLFELGVPYSDPLADGATMQRASQAVLRRGVTPSTCLDVAATINERTGLPISLMSYYNPVARYGEARFCRDAAAAGVAGLLIPDLPPEEAEGLRGETRKCGIDLVPFVAPTSTDDRLRLVASVAEGYIYCVALAGVTGARSSLSVDLPDYLKRVRRFTDLPLCVGFGISRPEHVSVVARYADGAIVASALVDLIDRVPPEERIGAAAAFARELRAATTRPAAGLE